MIDTAPADPPAPFPVLTAAAGAVCGVIFLALSLQGNNATWESVSRWGYLPPEAIWNGAYWGLITSAFVHFELWHVAFNVFWLWVLGGALEQTIGSGRWLLFVLAAAFVSSGAQFATGDTGIGMSGVGYALFGFGWMARDRIPSFARVLPDETVKVFLIWLVGCIVATAAGFANIGNAAHVGGMLFGMGVASFWLKRFPRVPVALGLALLIAIAVVPLFWCPWASGWTSKQAYDAHARENYRQAVKWYRRTLALGEDPKWVWHNLAQIHGYLGQPLEYRQALDQLRKLDAPAAAEVEKDYGRPEEAGKTRDQ
jgi:membrane associated rhomboid family serine protease